MKVNFCLWSQFWSSASAVVMNPFSIELVLCLEHFLPLKKSQKGDTKSENVFYSLSKLYPCCRTFSYRFPEFLQTLGILNQIICGWCLFTRMPQYNKILFFFKTVFVYPSVTDMRKSLVWSQRSLLMAQNNHNKSFGGTHEKQIQMTLEFSVKLLSCGMLCCLDS